MKDLFSGAQLIRHAWLVALHSYPKQVLAYIVLWIADLVARLGTIYFLLRALEAIQGSDGSGFHAAMLLFIGLVAAAASASALTARLVVHYRYALATKAASRSLLDTANVTEPDSNLAPNTKARNPSMSQLADLTRFQLEAYSIPLRTVAAFTYIFALLWLYPAMLLAALSAFLVVIPVWLRMIQTRKTMIQTQRQVQRELVGMLSEPHALDVAAVWPKLRSVFWPQEAEAQNAALSIFFQGIALAIVLLILLISPPTNLLTALAASLFLFRLAASEIGQLLQESASAARFALSAHQSLQPNAYTEISHDTLD